MSGISTSRQSRRQVNLFVPIETKVRELHGKILFSLIAANAGFRVIVGDQRVVRDILPLQLPGIYVDKSVAQSKNKWFKRIKALGNDIVAWDEEGLIFHDGSYVEKRFSKEAFEQVEKFYAWGKHHEEEILKTFPHAGRKILVSGNPRFDMLRPELRSFYSKYKDAIRSRIGRYVLINTNFGHVNHFVGPKYKEKIRKRGRGLEMITFIREWRKFQEKVFNAFVEAIKALAENIEDVQFVIRPHPSENHDFWRDLTSEFDNVHVEHEGNVIEWILAADCVIHNDCTTAVESYLLDVPVIAFRPEQSIKFETYLPNALSHTAASIDDLVEAVRRVVKEPEILVTGENGDNLRRKQDLAASFISSINGKLASETIVHDIASTINVLSNNKYKIRWLASIPYRTYYYLLTLYRKYTSQYHGIKYSEHKFDHLRINELNEITGQLSGLFPKNVRFHIEQLSDSCFLVFLSGNGRNSVDFG